LCGVGLLVGGHIEEDDGEHIQVPHAIDPREESTVDLEPVVPPVPGTLTDLVTHAGHVEYNCSQQEIITNT